MKKNKIINIGSKIKNQIIRRAEDISEKKSFLSIGSVAKRRRLQLHLTQAQACDSICSISYLSKLESNKIIPNDSYLDMLMERLNIERYELYMLKNADEEMKKVLDYFYNLDIDSYEDLYNLCKDYEENQVADVIKMGYFILKGEVFNAREYIHSNAQLMNTMTESVFMMYALFTAEILLELNEFDEINAIVSDITKMEHNKIYELLCKDLMFRLFVKENRIVLVGELYHELKMEYSQNVFVKRIERISEYYLKTLFNSGEYEFIATSRTLQTIGYDFIGEDEYNYIYGMSYYKSGNQYAGIDVLSKIKKYSHFYNKAIDCFYLSSQDRDEFLEDIIKENDRMPNFYLMYFINKTKNTLSSSLFSSIEYVNAIKDADIPERIELYKLERNFQIENFRYKEAVLIQKKIDNMIKNTKSSKNNHYSM